MALVCQSLGLVTAVNTRDSPLCHYTSVQASRAGVVGERHHGYLAASALGPQSMRASLTTQG